MADSQSYRCPKCGDTFAATAEIPVAAGCPSCRNSATGEWYLKVRGEVVGPIAFEALQDQVSASAAHLRRAGDADWSPAAEILPLNLSADREAAEIGLDDDAPSPKSTRNYVWPVLSCVLMFVVTACGWTYYHLTLTPAIEGSETVESAASNADRQRFDAAGRREAQMGNLQQLQERIAAEQYRRELLVDLVSRQERKLTSQVEQLKTMTRSRRFRRFGRGIDPPDDEPEKTLLTEFRKQLADGWAKTMARRQDDAAEDDFYRTEHRRLTGVAGAKALTDSDLAWLKTNGVKYRTRYNTLYTSAHKELMLYMEHATADEIVQFAAKTGLTLPTGKPLPADFADAAAKRKR